MNELVERIAGEIKSRGAIAFARFMELALHCPVYGYYEKQQDNIGCRGDYYTSVSVGPLFGQLLAFQFAEWAQGARCQVSGVRCQEQGIVQIVEAGAHGGELARDILNWLENNRPDIWPKLQYCIIEPSPLRTQWQQEKLRDFTHKIRWVNDLALLVTRHSSLDTRHSVPYRTIFSNELLDSFPVHRLGWDAKKRSWFEWGVTFHDGKFGWTKMEPSLHAPTLSRFYAPTSDLLAVLPDGYTTEISPAAIEWWQQAANALDCGKLLTIDYGLTAEELFAPHRTEGTLRAYHRHRASGDLLADPGEQDLTAHVNFTALQEAGELAGLKTEAFVIQPQFLTSIASQLWNETSPASWTASQKRQFQTLTHPDHLGRSFKVLVQSRSQLTDVNRVG